MFRLSKRSLNNLVGVNSGLVRVVKRAIELTTVDFVVIEGVRTLERQKELLKAGKTQTLDSNHLTGNAVDLLALTSKEGSWDWHDYGPIALAMAKAAVEFNLPIRWGAAWITKDIRILTLEDEPDVPHNTPLGLVENYIEYKRAKGQKPFIDAPHFEVHLK